EVPGIAPFTTKYSSIVEVGMSPRASRMMKTLWSSENGSALVEGAIVVPTLFAIVLGALEFAFFFYQQHLISTGVRNAARFLARSADPTNGANQTTARNLAATALPGGGTVRRVVGFDPDTTHVLINFTNVPNLPDPGTGFRPYRQTTPACGGPDAVRMIRVTGT